MTVSTGNVPGRIFMSYRREDAAYPAGWLYERLASHFSRDQVFRDIDATELGDDFIEVITAAVGSCDVLLALIGDRWLTITGRDGQRRLNSSDDFVRLEIEVALARNVRVIPILVGAARMPSADELPPSLTKLASRQALELSPSRFDIDIRPLLRVLDQIVAEAQERARHEAEEAAARRRQVEQLQGRLRERAAAQDWQAVVAASGELAALDPAAADPDGLASAAHEQITRRQEAKEQVRREAEEQARQEAEEAAVRRRQVEQLQGRLRERAAAQDWQAVVAASGELAALDPAAADPDGLASAAREQITRRQEAEEAVASGPAKTGTSPDADRTPGRQSGRISARARIFGSASAGSMRGTAWRRLAAAIALGMLAVGVFLASRLLAARGLAWASSVTSVASLVLAAATPMVLLLGKKFGWLPGAPPVSTITLVEARAGFADALAQQWAEEDRLRQVYDPWPLPVRWRLANGETGRFTGIYATFTRTPARRMVILGTAGAGKSVLAIKLVRDLLASRQPGDRVPVLLPAASWTRNCPLTEWITEQLVRREPNLDVRISTSTGAKVWLPRALADSGLIPVIDGLDELPQDRRTTVISEINAIGSDFPLVLTSRPEEYYAAVAGRGISQAVTIELEPLKVPEIKRYLTEATDGPTERWLGVCDRLDAEPDGVLAQTLATPLMIWLARAVYQVGKSDPDELLAPDRLADREAMESHLVAAFVPAVYAARQTRSRPRAFRCTPEQATRWLGFLANQLDRSQQQDIAWWQLSLAGRGLLIISMSVRAALYTCIFWLVSVWALTRRGYWHDGAYIGHGHYENLLLAGPLGQAVRPLLNTGILWLVRNEGLNVRQLSADIDGVLRGVAHLGLFPFACIAAGCGALGGVYSLFARSAPAPRTFRVTWHKLWRQLLNPLPWLLVLTFVWWDAHVNRQTPLSVLRSPAGWPVLLWLGLTLAGLAVRSLKTPIDVTANADPIGTLRGDRRTYLAGMIAAAVIGAATTWLWAGSVFAIADGTRHALGIVVVLLLGAAGGAWVSYIDCRLRLAALRRLPWRTISFLDDAYRRGVLRQTGAVYQFRHIRLQQQLAAGYSPSPRPVVPVFAWTGRQLARLRPYYPLLVADQASVASGADVGAAATEYAATLEGNSRRSAQAVVLLLQVLVMVAIFFIAVFVLPGWIAVLIVIADVALIPTVILAFDKINASAHLPVDRCSVHVAPGEVEITHGPDRIRLTPADVERIAVRPLGDSWFCYAVQAKLRPNVVGSGLEPRDWVPLFWTPRYKVRVPLGLVSALAGFAGNRLDHRLDDWLSRQAVVDYEASGIVTVNSISGALIGLSVALALTVIFLLVGWDIPTVLAILADLILISTCAYQLNQHRARKRLPSGPWSFRVNADAIEVTRADRTTRLSRGDIESVEFRPIWGNSTNTAIYARLQSGAAGLLDVTDGWYLLYWTSDFSENVPPELFLALGVFASGRLTGSLKRKSARALAQAPVYRGS